MEASRKFDEDPERAQARLAHLSVTERAQGDSEEFDPLSPTPERAEYDPRTSLAEDPALNTPRVSGALRNNIRFAERALAADVAYFKVMPGPRGGSFEVERVPAELFLEAAARLRDAERAFMEEHGLPEETRGDVKRWEILGHSHRPVAGQFDREYEHEVEIAGPGTSEFAPLKEGVAVHLGERGKKALRRLSPVGN
jgi:hypothetical protein